MSEIIRQTFERTAEGYHLVKYQILIGNDRWVDWDGQSRFNLITITHVNMPILLLHRGKKIRVGEVTQYYPPSTPADLIIAPQCQVPLEFPKESVEVKLGATDTSKVLDDLVITFTLLASNMRPSKLLLASLTIAGMAAIVSVGAKIFGRIQGSHPQLKIGWSFD